MDKGGQKMRCKVRLFRKLKEEVADQAPHKGAGGRRRIRRKRETMEANHQPWSWERTLVGLAAVGGVPNILSGNQTRSFRYQNHVHFYYSPSVCTALGRIIGRAWETHGYPLKCYLGFPDSAMM